MEELLHTDGFGVCFHTQLMPRTGRKVVTLSFSVLSEGVVGPQKSESYFFICVKPSLLPGSILGRRWLTHSPLFSNVF